LGLEPSLGLGDLGAHPLEPGRAIAAARAGHHVGMVQAVVGNGRASGFHPAQLLPARDPGIGVVDVVGGHEHGEGPAALAQAREGLVEDGNVGVVEGERDRALGDRLAGAHGAHQARQGPDLEVVLRKVVHVRLEGRRGDAGGRRGVVGDVVVGEHHRATGASRSRGGAQQQCEEQPIQALPHPDRCAG
jgi:hypothetical protein